MKAQMGKLPVIIRQWSDSIDKLAASVAIILTFILLALVTVQVVARYGFDTPPQWTEEAARFCMVWAGLLGSTSSFHRRVDPVLATPPRRLLHLMPRTISLVRAAGSGLFIIPILAYAPAFVSNQMVRETEALEINFALVVAIIPIWASILILHVVADLLNAEPDWLIVSGPDT